MARKDTINLEAIVTTDQAKANIKDLNDQLRETTELIDSLRGSGSTGNDLDQVYNKIREDLKKIGEVRSQTNAESRNSGSFSSSGERVTGDSIRKLDQEFNRVIQSFSDRISNFKDISSEQGSRVTPRPITRGGPAYQDEPRPDSLALRTREIQRTRQQVSSQTTSAISGLQNAADTGNISYKQAERLRGNLHNVYYDSTGATPDYLEDVRQIEQRGSSAWEHQMAPNTPLRMAQENIRESPEIIQGLQEQLAGVQALKDPEMQDEESMRELEMTERSILKEIKEQERFEQENQKLLTEIIDGINRVDSSVEKFEQRTDESGGVSVGPEEGTMAHAMSERSNAIALSVVTAAVYSITNSLKQGQNVVENERPASMEIGFSTGNFDFRDIRRDARESGSELGFRGTEMLDFTQSVMGAMGYTEETGAVVDELATGARHSGVSQEQMTSLYETALRSGSVESGDQAALMQEAISGGIIDSGMVGRQEEQVSAMNTLLDDLSAGREVDNEELQGQIAIMNLLAGTESESLQGQNLAQNLGSINANIQNSSMFSDLGFMMGVGRDEEFAGPGGAFRAREEMEKGLGSEYVIEGISEMVQMQGLDSALDSMVGSELFQGVSTDAIREIAQLAEQGDLTAENAQRVAEQSQATGAESYADAEEGFAESPDQTRLQKAADKEARQANLDENAVADTWHNISGGFENFGAGGAIQSVITTALGVGLNSALSSAVGPIFSKLSSGLKGMLGGKLGSMGEVLGGQTLAEGGKGLASAAKGGMGSLAAKATGFLTPGNISKMGKVGFGINAAVQTIGGVSEIAQADNKAAEAASQTGKVGGNLGGMWAGGKLGAAAGTFVGGPVGSLIGGALGGIGGALLGEKALGSVGDWVGNTFLGGTDESKEESAQDGLVTEVEAGEMNAEEQAALMENMNETASTNEEIAMQTQRGNIEERREDNVSQETENLVTWNNLINRIEDVLAIARQQNGIIGDMAGLGNSGTGMGVGGELGYVDEGEFWTSTNLAEHDLGKTTSTLTSDQLDAWISDKAPSNSAMMGMGDAFMEAGKQSGLDPRYLVAHAAHETAWGTSNIVQDKGNFYGIGAFDASPYASSYDYDNNEAGIIEGAKWIAENYYQDRGATTLNAMNKDYATDSGWANKIASAMKGSERYTSRSEGDVNITTNVTMNSSDNTESDGKKIASAVNAKIEPQFTREYRPV